MWIWHKKTISSYFRPYVGQITFDCQQQLVGNVGTTSGLKFKIRQTLPTKCVPFFWCIFRTASSLSFSIQELSKEKLEERGKGREKNAQEIMKRPENWKKLKS